jgi:hypothetical protein
MIDKLKYIDDLSHKNSEALSFIPKPRLAQYIDHGQVLIEIENDDPLANGIEFIQDWEEVMSVHPSTTGISFEKFAYDGRIWNPPVY